MAGNPAISRKTGEWALSGSLKCRIGLGRAEGIPALEVSFTQFGLNDLAWLVAALREREAAICTEQERIGTPETNGASTSSRSRIEREAF